jgi:hypothetical protein
MLAGGLQRTARGRGDLFLFDQRLSVPAHVGFLTQPKSVHIDNPIFTRWFSDAHLLSRSFNQYIEELYISISITGT